MKPVTRIKPEKRPYKNARELNVSRAFLILASDIKATVITAPWLF